MATQYLLKDNITATKYYEQNISPVNYNTGNNETDICLSLINGVLPNSNNTNTFVKDGELLNPGQNLKFTDPDGSICSQTFAIGANYNEIAKKSEIIVDDLLIGVDEELNNINTFISTDASNEPFLNNYLKIESTKNLGPFNSTNNIFQATFDENGFELLQMAVNTGYNQNNEKGLLNIYEDVSYNNLYALGKNTTKYFTEDESTKQLVVHDISLNNCVTTNLIGIQPQPNNTPLDHTKFGTFKFVVDPAEIIINQSEDTSLMPLRIDYIKTGKNIVLTNSNPIQNPNYLIKTLVISQLPSPAVMVDPWLNFSELALYDSNNNKLVYQTDFTLSINTTPNFYNPAYDFNKLFDNDKTTFFASGSSSNVILTITFTSTFGVSLSKIYIRNRSDFESTSIRLKNYRLNIYDIYNDSMSIDTIFKDIPSLYSNSVIDDYSVTFSIVTENTIPSGSIAGLDGLFNDGNNNLLPSSLSIDNYKQLFVDDTDNLNDEDGLLVEITKVNNAGFNFSDASNNTYASFDNTTIVDNVDYVKNVASLTHKLEINQQPMKIEALDGIIITGTNLPAKSKLRAYYKFDADSIQGNKVANYASGTPVYDATLMNGLSINTTDYKRGNGSLQFNASSNQYLQQTPFTYSSEGFSFAIWFKSNNSGAWARIMNYGNGINDNDVDITVNYGGNNLLRPQLNMNITPVAGDNVNYNNNVWTHLVLTINPNGQWKTYINGVLNTTDTKSYPTLVQNNLNYLGKSFFQDAYFNGLMDECLLYDIVLSAQDVSEIYSGEVSQIDDSGKDNLTYLHLSSDGEKLSSTDYNTDGEIKLSFDASNNRVNNINTSSDTFEVIVDYDTLNTELKTTKDVSYELKKYLLPTGYGQYDSTADSDGASLYSSLSQYYSDISMNTNINVNNSIKLIKVYPTYEIDNMSMYPLENNEIPIPNPTPVALDIKTTVTNLVNLSNESALRIKLTSKTISDLNIQTTNNDLLIHDTITPVINNKKWNLYFDPHYENEYLMSSLLVLSNPSNFPLFDKCVSMITNNESLNVSLEYTSYSEANSTTTLFESVNISYSDNGTRINSVITKQSIDYYNESPIIYKYEKLPNVFDSVNNKEYQMVKYVLSQNYQSQFMFPLSVFGNILLSTPLLNSVITTYLYYTTDTIINISYDGSSITTSKDKVIITSDANSISQQLTSQYKSTDEITLVDNNNNNNNNNRILLNFTIDKNSLTHLNGILQEKVYSNDNWTNLGNEITNIDTYYSTSQKSLSLNLLNYNISIVLVPQVSSNTQQSLELLDYEYAIPLAVNLDVLKLNVEGYNYPISDNLSLDLLKNPNDFITETLPSTGEKLNLLVDYTFIVNENIYTITINVYENSNKILTFTFDTTTYFAPFIIEKNIKPLFNINKILGTNPLIKLLKSGDESVSQGYLNGISSGKIDMSDGVKINYTNIKENKLLYFSLKSDKISVNLVGSASTPNYISTLEYSSNPNTKKVIIDYYRGYSNNNVTQSYKIVRKDLVSAQVIATPITTQILSTNNMNSITNGIFNGAQFQSNLVVAFNANLGGWNKGGGGSVHIVDIANTIGGTNTPNYVVMLWVDNVITQTNAVSNSNILNTQYTINYKAGPAVYQNPSQATGDTTSDGIVFEILRTNNTILATKTHYPGAWAGYPTLTPSSFTYTGDGSGDIRVRIRTLSSSTQRFGGCVDDVVISRPDISTATDTYVSDISGGIYVNKQHSINFNNTISINNSVKMLFSRLSDNLIENNKYVMNINVVGDNVKITRTINSIPTFVNTTTLANYLLYTFNPTTKIISRGIKSTNNVVYQIRYLLNYTRVYFVNDYKTKPSLIFYSDDSILEDSVSGLKNGKLITSTGLDNNGYINLTVTKDTIGDTLSYFVYAPPYLYATQASQFVSNSFPFNINDNPNDLIKRYFSVISNTKLQNKYIYNPFQGMDNLNDVTFSTLSTRKQLADYNNASKNNVLESINITGSKIKLTELRSTNPDVASQNGPQKDGIIYNGTIGDLINLSNDAKLYIQLINHNNGIFTISYTQELGGQYEILQANSGINTNIHTGNIVINIGNVILPNRSVIIQNKLVIGSIINIYDVYQMNNNNTIEIYLLKYVYSKLVNYSSIPGNVYLVNFPFKADEFYYSQVSIPLVTLGDKINNVLQKVSKSNLLLDVSGNIQWTKKIAFDNKFTLQITPLTVAGAAEMAAILFTNSEIQTNYTVVNIPNAYEILNGDGTHQTIITGLGKIKTQTINNSKVPANINIDFSLPNEQKALFALNNSNLYDTDINLIPVEKTLDTILFNWNSALN